MFCLPGGSNPPQCRKLVHHVKKQSTIHSFEGEVNDMNPLWALVG